MNGRRTSLLCFLTSNSIWNKMRKTFQFSSWPRIFGGCESGLEIVSICIKSKFLNFSELLSEVFSTKWKSEAEMIYRLTCLQANRGVNIRKYSLPFSFLYILFLLNGCFQSPWILLLQIIGATPTPTDKNTLSHACSQASTLKGYTTPCSNRCRGRGRDTNTWPFQTMQTY